MLQSYLLFILKDELIYKKYKIIFIGGSTNVVSLMTRNSTEEFFSCMEHVISILDADQKNKAYCKDNKNVFYSPYDDIENQLFIDYKNKEFDFTIKFPENIKENNKPKSLYKAIIKHKYMSDNDIFSFIDARNKEEADAFKKKLIEFLS